MTASVQDNLPDFEGAPRTPRQLAWQRLKRGKPAMVALVILAILHGVALFAPFITPYSPTAQRLELYFHPPTVPVWRDAAGHFTWRPEITPTVSTPSHGFIEQPAGRAPIRFFADGYRYRLFGIFPMRMHLFECRAPIFVLGTDGLGRDEFSRLLYGSQISLSVGLVAILITYCLGLVVGGAAGYFGGIIDYLLMRFSEIVLSIPGFYLLLAIAAVIPPTLSSTASYLLIIIILSLVGWAGLARVIRGIALATREHQYVEAARSLGVSPLRIIARHILPSTSTFAIVSATLAIPSYILGEAGLSFLGLGIREPAASWGNMLTASQNLEYLTQYPWILAPGVLIFITVICWNVLGDGLRDSLDPKGLR